MSTPREVLDVGEYWFLESLRYSSETLELHLAEGILSEPHQIDVLGIDAGEGRSLEVHPFSRRLAIRFTNVLAYQVYTESIAGPDKYQPEGNRGVLSEQSKSEYLDYLTAATYLPGVRGPFRHFSVILQDDILDVVTESDPEILEVSEPAYEADA